MEPSPSNKKFDISVCPGLLVTEDVVTLAMRSKLRVQTTKLYLKRLGDNKFDPSQGRVGIITGVNSTPEGKHHSAILSCCDRQAGCTANVIWESGKAFRGYCVGFRGYYDLEFASKSHLNQIASLTESKDETEVSSTETPQSRGLLCSQSINLDVNVGYLGSAPKVEKGGGKHLWSCTGPIFYK
eukprot:768455-Hanusia_phi.AAC.2